MRRLTKRTRANKPTLVAESAREKMVKERRSALSPSEERVDLECQFAAVRASDVKRHCWEKLNIPVMNAVVLEIGAGDSVEETEVADAELVFAERVYYAEDEDEDENVSSSVQLG